MESVKHQIEYKRLDEIRPYDNNPRRNDEAAKAVANSIREFGFQSPIIVDRDGVIIAGHTRYAKPDDLRHMKKDQLLDWAIKAQALLTQKPSSVIRCDKPPRNAEHPTMKPVVLCGRLIKNSSLPGQTVLDLFGGSGSTLIACEQLSRISYTMEYDPRYVDVIVQRWEDFTGEKAVRLK